MEFVDMSHRRESSASSPFRLFLLELERARDAIQLTLPLVAAVVEPLADPCRERLLRDEVAVALEGARNRALVAQRDAIGDLESRLFAQVVQMVGELAREAFQLELRRELGLERDRRPRVAAARVARRTFVGDEDLGVGELDPFDLDRPVAPLVASFRERLPNPRQILAELRPEDFEVGLHGLLHEALGRVPNLERLNIELVLDDLAQLRI